jgi:hypothetical protein
MLEKLESTNVRSVTIIVAKSQMNARFVVKSECVRVIIGQYLAHVALVFSSNIHGDSEVWAEAQ